MLTSGEPPSLHCKLIGSRAAAALPPPRSAAVETRETRTPGRVTVGALSKGKVLLVCPPVRVVTR